MAEWLLEEPRAIDIDEPVERLQVRLVGGHVDIVTTDLDTASVEVTDLDGTPVRVSVVDGRLVVTHEELTRDGIFGWLRSTHRSASVSIAVPATCEVTLAVVTAGAVVAGVQGRLSARSVSGEIVLDGIHGSVDVETVSGDLEARSLVGRLSFKTVSGELILVDGRPDRVQAHSVSGDVVLDLARQVQPDIAINTVSGDVTVRLPDETGLEVDLASMSGELSCAFPGVSIESRPGRRRLSGRVGAGGGSLNGKTMSGSIALVSRLPRPGGSVLAAS